MVNEPRGAVLVLPGGKPESATASRPHQLANQRMELLTRSMRSSLGAGVQVHRMQYRLRGWNHAQFDALRDARRVLDELLVDCEPAHIVVVGHSMGGRVAAHLSAGGDVGAVVALAPWWPRNDGDLVPPGCRLLVMHGTDDRWTDPRASQAQTERAQQRGVDACWVPFDGAGHYLIKDWRRWHRLTAEFVIDQLTDVA